MLDNGSTLSFPSSRGKIEIKKTGLEKELNKGAKICSS